MRYFVSSPYYSGGIWELEDDSCVRWTHRGVTGLDWNGNSLVGVEHEEGAIFFIDPGVSSSSCNISAGQAYHDLRLVGNHIYMVNSAKSRISIYEVGTQKYTFFREKWKPIITGADKEFKTCNFNSAWLWRDNWFGCAFALTIEKEGWRTRKKEGTIFTFDRQGAQTQLVRGLQQPHTVRVYDDGATVCDSIPGEFVIYGMPWQEKKRFKVRTRDGRTGFTRGSYRVSKNEWLVGLSANRHPEIYGYDEKHDIDTGYVVLVNSNGKTLHDWRLGSFEVYDIVGAE